MARKRPTLTFQDNQLLDPQKQSGLLDQVKRMGGTQIQQDVIWGSVRKGGAYDLSAYDQEVNEARKRGLGVRFRLMGTPDYMIRGQPGVDTALSSTTPNAGLMGQFAGDMAQHFKGRVGGYSVWNEPNVASFLNRSPMTAARTYRQLYQAGYKNIKRAAPNAQVGLGELTSQAPQTTGVPSTLGFLRNVLRGPKPLRADYFALHPYQWSNPNQQAGNPEYGGISNLKAVQAELRHAKQAGQLQTAAGGQVPLSISEYGYKHDAQPNDTTRARWLARSYDLAKQAGVRDMNLYQLLPSRKGDYWDSSILNNRGKLSPAMRAALKQMRNG